VFSFCAAVNNSDIIVVVLQIPAGLVLVLDFMRFACLSYLRPVYLLDAGKLFFLFFLLLLFLLLPFSKNA